MNTQRSPTNKIYLWIAYAIILGSLVVGAGRLTVPSHGFSWPGTYEAIAHIWVGALIVLCFDGATRRPAALSLGIITGFEIVMAVTG